MILLLILLRTDLQQLIPTQLLKEAHIELDLATVVQTITQTRASNTNVDIPGKIIVGKTTGARGRILKYTRGVQSGNCI